MLGFGKKPVRRHPSRISVDHKHDGKPQSAALPPAGRDGVGGYPPTHTAGIRASTIPAYQLDPNGMTLSSKL